MAYTSDDIILWGKISQPLSIRSESKKKATVGGSIDLDHHIKLYVERKSVEWYNDEPTQDADILYSISNWLFALEGVYGLQAQYIDGGSGGQVTPVTPSSTSLPTPLDWLVSASSEPLANGESSVTLNGTGGMPDFRGYNIEYSRGGIVQNTTPLGDGSTYYYWNRSTGLFQLFNGAAQTGELMRIFPDLVGSGVIETSNAPQTVYMDTDSTYTLASGYLISRITIKPTAADTVRIGTTLNGEEIMIDKLLTANVYANNGVSSVGDAAIADGASITIYFTGFTATAQINIYLLPIE